MFRSGSASRQEDDRLVDLFRSRVRLKKDLAALRNENYQLHDAIKRQADSVAGVERKLARLEGLLLDPDWSHNIVTFYQLRAVGDRCHERLKQHADKLRQQREEAVRSTKLAAWRRRREDKAFAVKRKISECRSSLHDLEARRTACRQGLDEMGIVRRLFRRRVVEAEIETIGARIDEKSRQEEALLAELQRIESTSPPGDECLDVRSKRLVNFQILAFAQRLFLQYDKLGLAQMVRDARATHAGAVSYGDKGDCDAIMARIRECDREDRIPLDSNTASATRTRLIADSAEFRREEDVIPIPASVATVYDFDEDGELLQQDIALLGENYFGLVSVLIR